MTRLSLKVRAGDSVPPNLGLADTSVPTLSNLFPPQINESQTVQCSAPISASVVQQVSLIPKSSANSSLYREFNGGDFQIKKVHLPRQNPYFVVVCRRRRPMAERERLGLYELCEIGPIDLILETKIDRGRFYLRVSTRTPIQIPDEWIKFAHFQDQELVHDERFEDHTILVSQQASDEAVLEIFSQVYPWTTRPPLLKRAGYALTYLRLDPLYLE